jgi:hypothetical protein
MNIQRFSRQEIALHQIETALSLFSREGDLFSVITLAGAAEEILGQLLQQRGSKPGAMASIFRILRPASKKKPESEGLSGHEVDGFVHLDPYHEAMFLLGRAIDDYIALSGAPSAGMLKFKEEPPARVR